MRRPDAISGGCGRTRTAKSYKIVQCALRRMKVRTIVSPWRYGQMRWTASAAESPRDSRACCTLSTLGFAPDPCFLACNALHCHALQLEKSHGGSGRKDEDDAAAAARTGAA